MIPVDRGFDAFGVLIVVGVASGIWSLVVFARCSDLDSLRRQANCWLAHLMELQLFSNEPALILRAQRELLRANWRILCLVARPLFILLLPMAAIFLACQAFFGSAPVELNEPFVVTARFAPGSSLDSADVLVPKGFSIETAGMRVPSEREVSWRLRPLAPVSGSLVVRASGSEVTKSIAAGTGWHWLSSERLGPARFLMDPFEVPILDGKTVEIRVRYRQATVFHVWWVVWFFLGSVGGPIIITLARCSIPSS